jgi:hypothetical protein
MKQRAPRSSRDLGGAPAHAVDGPATRHDVRDTLSSSVRQAAQRALLQAAFGLDTAQREAVRQAAPEEEEMLQSRHQPGAQSPVQRDIADDEEQTVQGHLFANAAAVQRNGSDEDEPLQGRSAGSLRGAAAVTAGALPPALQAGIESLSGVDVSDVRVHAGSSAPAHVGAHAFAQGPHIHLAPGQDRHLPHEAWHVVQQRQGRVMPTALVKGVPVNDDPSLEAEADLMGERATRHGASGPTQGQRLPPTAKQ